MTPENIDILIADDHQMFIDGIKALTRKEPHIRFIGEVADGNEAFRFIENHRPDLLITDISMPGMDGIELTKKVKLQYPEVKVLVVSMHNDRQVIGEILLAEAEGYILKNTGKSELLTAIGNIMDGGTHYSRDVLAVMLQQAREQERTSQEIQVLTARELEILNLIIREYSTAHIAEQLHISPRTVDTHRKHIMEKTGSSTIVGLIKFAFRNSLVH